MHPILMALALAAAADSAATDTMVVPLREVVVTGTRTRESAARAPSAISVVDKQAFRDSRGISLKDALWRVPGVFVQSRSGAQDVRISIRGFGARGAGGRSNSGALRGIRVLLDGIPITEPDGRTSLDLVDMESVSQVEVSRSNASALYGNASGGVVNLKTDLSFGRPYLEGRVAGGSHGFHREHVGAGLVFGRARGVATVMNSRFDGWRPNSGSSTAQANIRMKTPLDDRTSFGVFVSAVDNENHFPGPLTRAEFEATPRQSDSTFVANRERRRNRIARVAFSFDRELDVTQDLSLSLYVEPKVLERSQRGTFRDFNRYHIGSAATYQLRRSLQPGVEGNLTFAADEAWQDGSILFYTLTPDAERGNVLRTNKREGANSAGAFMQAGANFHERWSAKFGVRFDHQLYVSEDRMDPALDDRKTFHRWTPRASVSYLTPRNTFYAALGGGVEAPAFNEVNPPPELGLDTLTSFNPFLEPMHSTTYEIGARGELARGGALGRLRYDAAVYWIDVTNDLIPYDGGRYYFTAGASRRRGFELGLNWSPVGRLLLDGSFTISQNEFVTYVDQDTIDRSGNDQPGISPLFFSGSARYVWLSGLSAEVSVEASDGYFADDANTEKTPAYALLGATVAWVRPLSFGSLRAFMSGQNLTDEHHASSVFINGTNGRVFEPGLPANWSAGVTLRWR